MSETFTLLQFYQDNFPDHLARQCSFHPQMGHFNVFRRGALCRKFTQIHRSDFYKISLVIGTGVLHLEDRAIEVDGRALIFYNPERPHLWVPTSEIQKGYFCLFNDHFITTVFPDTTFRNSPLMNLDMDPVYPLSKPQASYLSFVFKKMLEEVDTEYSRKYEILHHCLHLILHEAYKMQPVPLTSEQPNRASTRITSKFVTLLERQFPIDSTEQSLRLKTPNDFAKILSVHVNHLNRAVKEVTGKRTSELIAERIANEAQNLLQFTDYSVAEIAYSLGFEYPSNFNSFFKRKTQKNPGMWRASLEKPGIV